ncbi:MAG: hypothetical protein ACEQSX_08230, partial [Baekduiaceae bacterium]
GAELTVTDAGWDLIMSIGPAGTELEGADLDRDFVLGAAHGAGAVAVLYNVVVKLEDILAALSIGFDPTPRPRIVTVDHNADPASDTPLQAAVRKLMEDGE